MNNNIFKKLLEKLKKDNKNKRLYKVVANNPEDKEIAKQYETILNFVKEEELKNNLEDAWTVNLECEFGCTGPPMFPSKGSVHLYDSKGNIAKCKCGNDAAGSIIGKNAYIHYCNECSPLC